MAKIKNFYVHQMVVHESESRETLEDRIFTRVTPSVSALIDQIVRESGVRDRSTWLRQVVNKACMEFTDSHA